MKKYSIQDILDGDSSDEDMYGAPKDKKFYNTHVPWLS